MIASATAAYPRCDDAAAPRAEGQAPRRVSRAAVGHAQARRRHARGAARRLPASSSAREVGAVRLAERPRPTAATSTSSCATRRASPRSTSSPRRRRSAPISRRTRANELTFGLVRQLDHELGNMMLGALSRRFIDADESATIPTTAGSTRSTSRPLARVMPDLFVGADLSYQARFPKGSTRSRCARRIPSVFQIAPMLVYSPMGPSAYDRPQLRLVYRAAHLNEGALDLVRARRSAARARVGPLPRLRRPSGGSTRRRTATDSCGRAPTATSSRDRCDTRASCTAPRRPCTTGCRCSRRRTRTSCRTRRSCTSWTRALRSHGPGPHVTVSHELRDRARDAARRALLAVDAVAAGVVVVARMSHL